MNQVARSPLAQPPHTPARGFNPAINGLRGVCALDLLIYHVFNSGIIAWPSDTPFERAGIFLLGTLRFGVELFFMISGFVIVGSLLRHASLQRFYLDRFVRIYALWLPLLLAICALGPISGWRAFNGSYDGDWLVLSVANLLLLPPLLPLASAHPASWSLSYEWLFYLGAGLVWRLGVSRWHRSALPIAILLFGCAMIVIPRSVFFAVGVIVFLAQHRLPALERWLRFPFLSLLLFLFAWQTTGIGNASPLYGAEAWLGYKQWVLTALAFAAGLHCFACIAARNSLLSRMLESSLCQRLGNMSFSLYLVSGMVMFAVKKMCMAYLDGELSPVWVLAIFGAVSLLLSLALSLLTKALLEERLTRHMHGWLYRFAPKLRSANAGTSLASNSTPVPASSSSSV